MKYANLEQRLMHRCVEIPEGEEHAGCWMWMWMGRVEANGYARIGFYEGGGRAAPGRGAKNKEVHRVAYETFTGKAIPEGYDIDHICHFRICINPAHLRPRPAPKNRSEGARRGNKMRVLAVPGHQKVVA